MSRLGLGPAWARSVLSIELKKVLSYRIDFWIQIFFGTFCEMAVAYFLWRAIYSLRGESVIEGYSFSGLIYYYLFSSFSIRIARGQDRGYISEEVYQGSLTRYLLYPLPFMGYKYVTHLAAQLVSVLQLLLAFAAMSLLLDWPAEQNLTIGSFAAGIMTTLLVGYLHFVMASCLEMVSFWQDVVWNLMVMLRFIVQLLGGAMIPLVFFPDWGQRLVSYTPFPLLISYPARTFLGQISFEVWWQNFALLVVWSAVFTWLASVIWARGTKQYSGVGI